MAYCSADALLPKHTIHFELFVQRSPGECWNWQGPLDRYGYGVSRVRTRGGNQAIGAHRLAYLLLRGDIPDGLQVDHLCRNIACVNPDHLEVVTQQENKARKNRATHCPRGHEFSEANSYWRRDKSGTSAGTLVRRCRECMTLRARWRKERAALARAQAA